MLLLIVFKKVFQFYIVYLFLVYSIDCICETEDFLVKRRKKKLISLIIVIKMLEVTTTRIEKTNEIKRKVEYCILWGEKNGRN